MEADSPTLTNGESKKPLIHLVKKSAKSQIMSMQVEDEVEIMDDSEDELVVNRSSSFHKKHYGRDREDLIEHKLKKRRILQMNHEDLDDDTEEELSLLYEDDEEEIKIKDEPIDYVENTEEQNGEKAEVVNGHGIAEEQEHNDSNKIQSETGEILLKCHTYFWIFS